MHYITHDRSNITAKCFMMDVTCQVLVSRCSSVEVGTDQEVDTEEANAAHPPYVTPASASVTMSSSISLLNKWVVGGNMSTFFLIGFLPISSL